MPEEAQTTEQPQKQAPQPSREQFYQKEGLTEPAPKPAETQPTPQAQAQEPATPTAESPPKPTDVQPEPTPTPPAPKLYAGKFKSTEDLEKGYQELQSLQSRKNAEINKALKEMADANREGGDISDAMMGSKAEEAPDPMLDPKGYHDFVKKDILGTLQQKQQADDIRNEWRAKNEDILDLEQLVSFRLFSDPRLREAKTLQDAGQLIEEHTAYARGLATKYREAGRKEYQTKIDSIPPSAPQSSIEGPPQAETPQATDNVSDAVAMRQRFRMGRPLRSRG